MKRVISDDEDEYISYCKRSRKLSIDEGIERLSLDNNAKRVMFSTEVSYIGDNSNIKESLTDDDDAIDNTRRHSYTAVDQCPLAYEGNSRSSTATTSSGSTKIDTEDDDNKVEIGRSSASDDFSVQATPSRAGMYYIIKNYSLKDVNDNPTLPTPSRTDEGISSCSSSANNSDSTKVGASDNNATSTIGKDNEDTTITSQENYDSNVDTICSMVTAVQVASDDDDSQSMCSRSSLEDIQIIDDSETKHSGPTIEEIQENTEFTTDDEDNDEDRRFSHECNNNNRQHYNSDASSEIEEDTGDYYYDREEEYNSSDESFCSICGKYHD